MRSVVGPDIANPKLRSREDAAVWYQYYAGYSEDFVRNALHGLGIRKGSVVLDPWNGAGTTTFVADYAGYEAVGFDLNPAMVIIARGRSARIVPEHVVSMVDSLVGAAKRHRGGVGASALGRWLAPETANALVRLERAIRSQCGLLNAPINRRWELHGPSAVLYTGLFRTLQAIVRPLRSKNPTWLKTPSDGARICVETDELLAAFRAQVDELIALRTRAETVSSGPGPRIEVSASHRLPLGASVVDAIIASPPYCTRIDYVAATLPELTLLGYGDTDIRALREGMIGTPTVGGQQPCPQASWGETCLGFLERVKGHSSKASSTYYWKTLAQYFEGAHSSMREADRVLRHDGYCILVVQDSYYKEIHNNLAASYVEMAEHIGWSLLKQIDFETRRSMAGINSKSKKYRVSHSPVESVLIFRKP